MNTVENNGGTMKLELTLDQINIILTALGELPAKHSFALIKEIHEQVEEQK